MAILLDIESVVHPAIAIGYNNILQHKHFQDFISDFLKHDTVFVKFVKNRIVEHLKNEIQKLSMVQYFSDGCKAHQKIARAFLIYLTIRMTNKSKLYGVLVLKTAHGKGDIWISGGFHI